MNDRKRIGLIVNPIAGMGGRVGLKGTDGSRILVEALRRGAEPVAGYRAILALRFLKPYGNLFLIMTASGPMGEDIVRSLGLPYQVVYHPGRRTTSEDTEETARRLREAGIDLLLFVGGDGTARDIYCAIGDPIPTLGIPAGVKIQSSVFARTPEMAGNLVAAFLQGKRISWVEGEIVDLDEEAYREGRIVSRLYGRFRIPFLAGVIQHRKTPSRRSERSKQEAIATDIVERMEKNVIYFIGPGSTPYRILEHLNLSGTLLGVDAVQDGRLIGKDLDERTILSQLRPDSCTLVLTPIGGQGMLFGRGNQMFSPRVLWQLSKERIWIVATPEKIAGLEGRPLYVDTGDPELDISLAGYWRIITGYREEIVYRVEA